MNPFAAEDPGQPQVTGRIGDGFNLDGKFKPAFVSPDGEKGIDNKLYRAWGCDAPWRGEWQRHPVSALQRQDAGRPLHHRDPRSRATRTR